MTILNLPDKHQQTAWQRRVQRHYEQIHDFYLRLGRTEQQWQLVTQDPHKFNRVWRLMLRLPPANTPPPKEFRS